MGNKYIYLNELYEVMMIPWISDGIIYYETELRTANMSPKTFDDSLKNGTLKKPYGFQTPLWKVLNGETND